MTRFARAKGSKSSNEKTPEEATPWSELKMGILKSVKPTEETKRCVSMLKAKTKKEEAPEWASLSDCSDNELNVLKKHLQQKQEGKNTNTGSNIEGKKGMKRKESDGNETYSVPKKKKKIKKRVENVCVVAGDVNVIKKTRKKGSVEVNKENNEVVSKLKKNRIELVKGDKSQEKSALKENRKKKKKKKISKGTKVERDMNEQRRVKKKKSKELIVEKSEGEDQIKEVKEIKKADVTQSVKQLENATKKMLTDRKKMRNFAGGKGVRTGITLGGSQIRSGKTGKKLISERMNMKSNKFATKIEVGGEMVNLVKFQGFYVKEEDAKRLKELRKKMTEQGIEEAQIQSALKLERRRCEKALARMKKNVCFQCRKPGHILSQCPEMQMNVDTGTGVCYKCGSTEHKAFTCKVAQGQNFPFAECFICKEKGHIARECPDNPRGLYPKGGCCKVCGDVTHLKKDCPKGLCEKEEKTIRLKMRDERNLEGLEDVTAEEEPVGRKERKKPVRF